VDRAAAGVTTSAVASQASERRRRRQYLAIAAPNFRRRRPQSAVEISRCSGVEILALTEAGFLIGLQKQRENEASF